MFVKYVLEGLGLPFVTLTGLLFVTLTFSAILVLFCLIKVYNAF